MPQATPQTDLIRMEIRCAVDQLKKAFVKDANLMLRRYNNELPDWECNLNFALRDNLLAALVAQEPQFTCVPLNIEGEKICEAEEKLLRHYAMDLGLQTKVMRAFDWALQTGTGYIKVGFYNSEGAAEIGVPGSYELGSKDVVKPYLSVPDPRTVFVDPYATIADFKLSDARYCGEIIRNTLGRIMANIDYDMTVAAELEPDEISPDYPVTKNLDRVHSAKDLPKDQGLKTLYEIHLRSAKNQIQLLTFADKEPRPLYNESLDPSFNRFPYVPIQFCPQLDSFWGKSIFARSHIIVKEISNILRRIASSWQNCPNILGVNVDVVTDETSLNAIRESSGNWKIIEHRIGDPIRTYQGKILNMEEIQYLNLLIEYFHFITGITYQDIGRASSRTATEAGNIQRSADLRTGLRMNLAEQFVSEVGQVLWRILRYNYDKIPLNEILGGELATKVIAYEQAQSRRERLEMDTDIKVRMSLPIHGAAEFRRNKALELMRSLAVPELLELLRQQGKTIDFGAITDRIAADSGIEAPIIIDMPATVAASPEGTAAEE
jgi:hypothetical protein